MLKPYKFLVTPVCQDVDADGTVLGEHALSAEGGQPAVLFGVQALIEWAGGFQANLDAANGPPLPAPKAEKET